MWFIEVIGFGKHFFCSNNKKTFFSMCHIDPSRLRGYLVIFHRIILHSGHDRYANARILAAFCCKQQSRNVGVARGAGRTGEIRQNFSVAGQITAGPTSKIKDARISDADASTSARSNSVAISSILYSERKSFGRNKSEQRNRRREFGREFAGARASAGRASDIIRRDFCHPLPRNSNPRRRGKRSGTR